MAGVRWMEADDPENPFRIRIVNCMSTAMGLLSVTQDAKIAAQYSRLRKDDGKRCIGKLPDDALIVACALEYPFERPVPDGPVRLSAEMEDKWDIYFYSGRWYFARSWTGDLVLTASARISESKMYVDEVAGKKDLVWNDPVYLTRLVDFMIKSHLYGWRVPRPLAKNSPADPKMIAVDCFALAGRHAFAATFEDTMPFKGAGIREGSTPGASSTAK